ncbi:hypothetical protein RM545_10245 [Zunongwangia sp. F260]|uniref:DUF4157 domain-containing protein n=1 Tax=Autumnicola lenta TaxID=3075593 RepID=A0ABU3CL45_9FLAO|nr:hypothetical protein [Zunongwangia sp. F260]MDT0647072.1 hypothetical protein [Zunongwangia sp. F260]
MLKTKMKGRKSVKTSTGNFSLLLIFFFMLSSSEPAKGQNSDLEYGLYNITSGAIIGGIGAVINKKPNQKFHKVFLKGFSQGALGGYMIFESKRLIRQFGITNNYAYVWPSHLLNATGASMIENGAANRSFGEEWHLNIGFNRIEFNTKENFKVRYRIMPFALIGTIENAFYGEFNLQRTLKTGFPVFTTDHIDVRDSGYAVIYGQTTWSNSILILANEFGENSLAHEIIHVYQYGQFSGFNSYLDKPVKALSKESRFWKHYNRIFYTDFNYLIASGSYYFLDPDRNWDNPYEKEARFYSK